MRDGGRDLRVQDRAGSEIVLEQRIVAERQLLLKLRWRLRKVCAALVQLLLQPLYVVGRSVSANTVTLGSDAALYRARVRVREVSFLSGRTPSAPLRITAKLRYNQKPASATLWPEDGGAAVVEFDAPQRAVSPGQAAVFYADDYLLGGGTICGSAAD